MTSANENSARRRRVFLGGRTMRDEIVIDYRDSYIHVRQYGRDNYDVSLDLWRRIVAACDEYNCFNILGESYTTEELSTADAYDHIKIFRLAGVTMRHRIAWVHHGEDLAKNSQFIEDTLTNRGLANGSFFPSIEEAERWLLGNR